MHYSKKTRLLAGLALVFYGILLGSVVWFLLHNLLLTITLSLTLFGLVYAIWLLVTGSGRRVWLGGLLAVFFGALSAAGVVSAVRQVDAWQPLLILLVVAGAYLGLVAVLRAKYWVEARRHGGTTGHKAHFRHAFLIVNPKSGDGRAIKARVPELASRQGITVLTTSAGQDIGVLARQAVADGADVLGVSGGDGTIGAVAKVALEYKLPIVVLPGGTRCHFARDIGLDPKRIADALAGFYGVERRVDAASVNGRIFLNNASFGLYADIIDNPDYRGHKREVSRKVMRSIVSGAKPAYGLEFHSSDKAFRSAVQVLVGVNCYNTVDIFELGHRDRLDEGVLQVTAITQLDNATMLGLLRAITFKRLGQHQKTRGLYQWTSDTFDISADSPDRKLVVGVDGEREEYDTPVRVRILPSALSVYVPAEGIRGRSKNPFSLFIGKQLRRAALHPNDLLL